LLHSKQANGFVDAFGEVTIMKRTTQVVFAAILSVPAALLFSNRLDAQETRAIPLVHLQDSTPGVPQTGHTNITGTAIAGQFAGGGAGLTAVNADLLDGLNSTAFALLSHNHSGTQITSGTVADARLSTNVGFLSNTQAWIGRNLFSNSGNFFAGDGAGLTNVDAATLGGLLVTQFGRLTSGQTWTGINTFSNTSNAFTGNGAGLINVDALTLGGLAPTAFGRLGSAQTWTAANTFSNASNSFTGNGAGLAGVDAATLDGLNSTAFGRLNSSQIWTTTNIFDGSPSGATDFITVSDDRADVNAYTVDIDTENVGIRILRGTGGQSWVNNAAITASAASGYGIHSVTADPGFSAIRAKSLDTDEFTDLCGPNGAVATTGHVTRRYDGANYSAATPIAYGLIASSGGVSGSTGNVSATRPSTGVYEITITGESPSSSGAIIVTPRTTSPRFTSVEPSGSIFRVRIWDAGGTAVNDNFYFVMFKANPVASPEGGPRPKP